MRRVIQNIVDSIEDLMQWILILIVMIIIFSPFIIIAILLIKSLIYIVLM